MSEWETQCERFLNRNFLNNFKKFSAKHHIPKSEENQLYINHPPVKPPSVGHPKKQAPLPPPPQIPAPPPGNIPQLLKQQVSNGVQSGHPPKLPKSRRFFKPSLLLQHYRGQNLSVGQIIKDSSTLGTVKSGNISSDLSSSSSETEIYRL